MISKSEKPGPSDLPRFRAGASGSCSFHVSIYFGYSTGELTTSNMSSKKGEISDNNGSDKGNILKPSFDTLMEEGRKAFKAYLTDIEELFLSRCEVARQGTVL
jgi:hypothetical protein